MNTFNIIFSKSNNIKINCYFISTLILPLIITNNILSNAKNNYTTYIPKIYGV